MPKKHAARDMVAEVLVTLEEHEASQLEFNFNPYVRHPHSQLVTGKNRHPANVVFRVESRTRNGWLRCKLHSNRRHSDPRDRLRLPFRTRHDLPIKIMNTLVSAQKI